MFFVTKDGKKITIDDSQFGDRDWYPMQETVGLYSDDTILKEVWILELNRRDYFKNSHRDFELEFVKDLKFNHEPTQEEILWAMSAFGCTRGDIVLVRKGYELDMEWD
jgi:hypothetical protein